MSENTIAQYLTAAKVEISKAQMDENATLKMVYLGSAISFIVEVEMQLGLEDERELLTELSTLLDEHPDGWEGPCNCYECRTA